MNLIMKKNLYYFMYLHILCIFSIFTLTVLNTRVELDTKFCKYFHTHTCVCVCMYWQNVYLMLFRFPSQELWFRLLSTVVTHYWILILQSLHPQPWGPILNSTNFSILFYLFWLKNNSLSCWHLAKRGKWIFLCKLFTFFSILYIYIYNMRVFLFICKYVIL